MKKFTLWMKYTALAVFAFLLAGFVCGPVFAGEDHGPPGPTMTVAEYNKAVEDNPYLIPWNDGLVPLDHLAASCDPDFGGGWAREWAILASSAIADETGINPLRVLPAVERALKTELLELRALFLQNHHGSLPPINVIVVIEERGKETCFPFRLSVERNSLEGKWVTAVSSITLDEIRAEDESLHLPESFDGFFAVKGGVPTGATCDNPGDNKKSGCLKVYDSVGEHYVVKCGKDVYEPYMVQPGKKESGFWIGPNNDVLMECNGNGKGGIFFVTVRLEVNGESGSAGIIGINPDPTKGPGGCLG